MLVLGLVVTVVGTALFFISLGMTLRANPTTIVPYHRNPDIVPRYTVLMRSVGAGLFVFCTVLLGPTIGYWAVLIPTVITVVTLTSMILHNRAVE